MSRESPALPAEPIDAAAAEAKAFGLYIHIPFCKRKCPYCDFNSVAVSRPPYKRYFDALLLEWAHYRRRRGFAGRPLCSIFFGGGTPSLAPPKQIARLLELVLDGTDRRPPVGIPIDVTLEANPTGMAYGAFCALREAGVNRLSLGAQSFRQRRLDFLGRSHTPKETRAAVEMARRAGFRNISLDLVFGLAGETLSDVDREIEAAAAIGPDHISAYLLTVEPDTILFERQSRGGLRMPSADRQAALYERACRRLAEAGYAAYEISNFAQPGRESQHNRIYWMRGDYLGLGAGAHSHRAVSGPRRRFGLRWWNEKDFRLYIERVERAGSARAGAERIDRETAMRESALLELRLAEGIDLARFESSFGEPLEERKREALEELSTGGLIERLPGRIRLTNRGRTVVDSLLVRLSQN